MKTVLKYASAIALAMPFVLLGIEVWVKYPCNHGGGVAMYVALGGLALAVNLLYMVLARRVDGSRMGMFVLLALTLWMCDRCNVLVSYEEWIGRGMPAWGETTERPMEFQQNPVPGNPGSKAPAQSIP